MAADAGEKAGTAKAHVLERRVRFEDVDAAGLVFFPVFLAYAHEAMEHFFDELEGGYSALILKRRVGLPAVHIESDFRAPLRYGDCMRIETTVARLGTRSLVMRYRFFRSTGPGAAAAPGELCAEVRHTVVTTNLDELRSCDMPSDVRAAAEARLER